MTRLSLAFLIALTATSAGAQTCGSHDKLSAELKKNHGEEQMVILVQPNGAILHIFANPKKRNWTVLNVMPNGWSCIMGAGNGYVSKVGKLGEAS